MHAEATGLLGTNFDLGLTYLMSKVENQGSITVTLPSPPFALNIYGLGATAEGESVSGSTMLLSARYRWNETTFGGEYLKGSKGVWVNAATEDLLSFYGTAGTGTHLYINQKFAEAFSVRLGYMQQKSEYASLVSSYGRAIASSSQSRNNYYLAVRADF